MLSAPPFCRNFSPGRSLSRSLSASSASQSDRARRLRRRLIAYSILGWGLPALTTAAALAAHRWLPAEGHSAFPRPSFGLNSCWFYGANFIASISRECRGVICAENRTTTTTTTTKTTTASRANRYTTVLVAAIRLTTAFTRRNVGDGSLLLRAGGSGVDGQCRLVRSRGVQRRLRLRPRGEWNQRWRKLRARRWPGSGATTT